MREILFRGKSVLNLKWLFGSLLKTDEKFFVIQNFDPFGGLAKYEVYNNTVCQYTGLHDKNGNKIFKGDIVKEESTIGIVKFGKYSNGFHCGFYIEWRAFPYLRPELAFWNSKIQVVGNIFDNPELLGGDSY